MKVKDNWDLIASYQNFNLICKNAIFLVLDCFYCEFILKESLINK